MDHKLGGVTVRTGVNAVRDALPSSAEPLAMTGAATMPSVVGEVPSFGVRAAGPSGLPRSYYREIRLGYWLAALVAGAFGWWILLRLY